MENKLFEAASKGCINSLHTLLKQDPLILDRITTTSFDETPLHVAAMLGHVNFTKKIIQIKPQLTEELNSHKSSPLHLASAKGHVEIVRALLSVDQQMCMARDKKGLTPLHLAAARGRLDVVRLLLEVNPEAARLTGFCGETILHLCVKRGELEVLKVLVRSVGDWELVNCKDGDGNSVLHLAVEDKQVETINFLLTIPALDVNARNGDGMTALDVLIQSKRDVRDLEIEKSFKNARGTETLETNAARGTNSNNWKKLLKQQDEWLDKKKSTVMVVASLIATMAFQVGVNPPSGIWQDDSTFSAGAPTSSMDYYPHQAGSSVLAYNSPATYTWFYMVNTLSFVASLSIILLLMSGLPLRRRFFMWFLMVITWIAITAIAGTYIIAIMVLTPSPQQRSVVYVIGISVFVWVILMALLLLGHTIRVIVKLIKTLRKKLRSRRRINRVRSS